MESAFAAILRSLTLLQRDQLSNIAKLSISSWNFLDLADEIAGVGAVSSGDQIAEQHERLFKPVKSGLDNLCTVCCHKVFSVLIAVLFEEIAFALLKVLLNLSAEARQDVQLVDDGGHENSLADDLFGFAAKECSTTTLNSVFMFTLLLSGSCCWIGHRQLCQTIRRQDFHGRHSREDTYGAIQSIHENPQCNAGPVSSLPK